MLNDEIKKAFFERSPVEYNKIKYPYINAVIYRRVGRSTIMQVELYDNEKCIVIANPERVNMCGTLH